MQLKKKKSIRPQSPCFFGVGLFISNKVKGNFSVEYSFLRDISLSPYLLFFTKFTHPKSFFHIQGPNLFWKLIFFRNYNDLQCNKSEPLMHLLDSIQISANWFFELPIIPVHNLFSHTFSLWLSLLVRRSSILTRQFGSPYALSKMKQFFWIAALNWKIGLTLLTCCKFTNLN